MKQIKGLVSVVITTKNESDVIERLLKSLVEQTYQKLEIILVDNNSTDRTKIIAKKFPVKILNFGPERSAQRNFGIKNSHGEYVLVLDADMEPSNNVISECVMACKKETKIASVVIPEESAAKRYWEKVKAFERSFYNLEGDSCVEAARFFRRDVLNSVGGYDENITGPEDWDLPDMIRKKGFEQYRIGAKIFHYERIKSLTGLLKKKYYYALKSPRYLKKQKISVISPKTIYFLRPVFYRNWKRILTNPLMAVSMVFMLTMEMVAGGAGFMVGKITSK